MAALMPSNSKYGSIASSACDLPPSSYDARCAGNQTDQKLTSMKNTDKEDWATRWYADSVRKRGSDEANGTNRSRGTMPWTHLNTSSPQDALGLGSLSGSSALLASSHCDTGRSNSLQPASQPWNRRPIVTESTLEQEQQQQNDLNAWNRRASESTRANSHATHQLGGSRAVHDIPLTLGQSDPISMSSQTRNGFRGPYLDAGSYQAGHAGPPKRAMGATALPPLHTGRLTNDTTDSKNSFLDPYRHRNSFPSYLFVGGDNHISPISPNTAQTPGALPPWHEAGDPSTLRGQFARLGLGDNGGLATDLHRGTTYPDTAEDASTFHNASTQSFRPAALPGRSSMNAGDRIDGPIASPYPISLDRPIRTPTQAESADMVRRQPALDSSVSSMLQHHPGRNWHGSGPHARPLCSPAGTPLAWTEDQQRAYFEYALQHRSYAGNLRELYALPYGYGSLGDSHLKDVAAPYNSLPLSGYDLYGMPMSPRTVAPGESDGGRTVRSVVLEEFRKTCRGQRWELKDIYDHVVEFSGDQHGSRFIQQKLASANSEEKDRIFQETITNAVPLMKDVFGNYVLQKFFEHGDQVQKKLLLEKMQGHVLELTKHIYGCRVVQTAIEHILVEQQASVVKELERSIMECIKSEHGNHVIQKAVEHVPVQHIPFIIAVFRGNTQFLATHRYGCRVVQRVLERCDDTIKTPILYELHACMPQLIQDQFGNYVPSLIVQIGHSADRNKIFDVVLSSLIPFAKQKFASNVVERCVEKGTDEQRRKIMFRLCELDERTSESQLPYLIRDGYGNYVIQSLLDHLREQDYHWFVDVLEPEVQRARRPGPNKQAENVAKKMRRFDPSNVMPSTAAGAAVRFPTWGTGLNGVASNNTQGSPNGGGSSGDSGSAHTLPTHLQMQMPLSTMRRTLPPSFPAGSFPPPHSSYNNMGCGGPGPSPLSATAPGIPFSGCALPPSPAPTLSKGFLSGNDTQQAIGESLAPRGCTVAGTIGDGRSTMTTPSLTASNTESPGSK